MHQASALAHQPYAVAEIHDAADHHGGVLSQAMAGNCHRLRGSLTQEFLPRSPDGDADRHDGGLGKGGVLEGFRRAFKHHPREADAQAVVGFLKNAAGRCGTFVQGLPHADFLGALPRKDVRIDGSSFDVSHTTALQSLRRRPSARDRSHRRGKQHGEAWLARIGDNAQGSSPVVGRPAKKAGGPCELGSVFSLVVHPFHFQIGTTVAR